MSEALYAYLLLHDKDLESLTETFTQSIPHFFKFVNVEISEVSILFTVWLNHDI